MGGGVGGISLPSAAGVPRRGTGWASPGVAPFAVRAFTVGLGYFLLAFVGNRIATEAGGPAPVWLATALVAACVARFPPSTWPSFLVGAVAAELLTDLAVLQLSVATAAVYVVADVTEALLAGVLLRTFGATRMQRPRDLVGLTAAAAIAASVGGVVAGVGLARVEGASVTSTWIGWLVADAVGMILLIPALLTRRPQLPATRAGLVELGAVVVATVGLSLAVFSRPVAPGAFTPVQALLVPVLVWAGVRFGILLVSVLAPFVMIVGLVGTIRGDGPFATYADASENVLAVQLFVGCASLAVFAVALIEEDRRRAEGQERRSRALVDQLVANTPAMIFVKSYDGEGPDGRYIMANEHFCEAVGEPPGSLLGRTENDLLPDYAGQFVAEDREVLSTGRSAVYEGSTLRDGVEHFHHTAKFPIHDAAGRPVAVGAIAFDVTERRQRSDLLREMFERSPVPTARVGIDQPVAGVVLDANDALAALLRIDVGRLVGRQIDDFLHGDEREVPLLPIEAQAFPATNGRERRLLRGDGEPVWARVTAAAIRASESDPAFALVTLEDVTSRRHAEESLTHQALHDMLTGLLNRTALMDRLSSAMNRLWRSPSYAAVLFCDLDGFKHLNDTRGHRVGDEILVQVADRLRGSIRPEDTLARLGGDEFVVMAEGLRTAGEARLVGDNIRAALASPFELDGVAHALTVSIGIATTTDPQTRPEDLLRRADLAMYRAKDAGRDRVEFYVAELEQRVVAHLAAQDLLRSALSEDRIVPYFQPVVALPSGMVLGAEALARLVHPEEGVLPPARFIAEAEQSGLVNPLGERMLVKSLAQAAAWAGSGRRLRLAVNASPRQLAHAGFSAHVLQLLAGAGLDPDDLVIEVTESAVLDATGPTILALKRLREHGVHVAIDDFGTGYATLSGLKYLPADIIKIDRAFVAGLVDDPDDAAIVSAVIRVAHDLGRTVVAEGVETKEQQAALVELGCDEAQGYLYSRPVPAAEFPSTVPVPRGVGREPVPVRLGRDTDGARSA